MTQKQQCLHHHSWYTHMGGVRGTNCPFSLWLSLRSLILLTKTAMKWTSVRANRPPPSLSMECLCGLCRKLSLLPINIPGRSTNWETSDKYAFEDTYGLVIHLIFDTRASRCEINQDLFYQWYLLVCAYAVLHFCQGKPRRRQASVHWGVDWNSGLKVVLYQLVSIQFSFPSPERLWFGTRAQPKCTSST